MIKIEIIQINIFSTSPAEKYSLVVVLKATMCWNNQLVFSSSCPTWTWTICESSQSAYNFWIIWGIWLSYMPLYILYYICICFYYQCTDIVLDSFCDKIHYESWLHVKRVLWLWMRRWMLLVGVLCVILCQREIQE